MAFPRDGDVSMKWLHHEAGATLLRVLLISKEAKTYAVWPACPMVLGGEREGGWEESIGHQLNHGCGCKDDTIRVDKILPASTDT